MAILSYEGVKNKPEILIAMTSLNKEEFEELRNIFENAWDEHINDSSQEKDIKDG